LREGRTTPRGRDGPLGMRTGQAVGRAASDPSRRRFAVRTARTDRGSAMGGVCCTRRAASGGRPRRCPPSIRSPPTPARSRCRDGARGDPDHGHPKAIRARRSRRHLGLLAWNRQQRDHRHRPRTPSPDDVRERSAPNRAADLPPPGRPGHASNSTAVAD
jgi:hypothetical protein